MSSSATIFKPHSDSKKTELESIPNQYVDEIVLHNEDNDLIFCYIVRSAKLTIHRADGSIAINGQSMSETAGDAFSFNKLRYQKLLFIKNEDLDEDDKACVRKGLVNPVFLPATIFIMGVKDDRWGSQGHLFCEKMTIEKLNPSSILDGKLHISYNKGFTLKTNPAHASALLSDDAQKMAVKK